MTTPDTFKIIKYNPDTRFFKHLCDTCKQPFGKEVYYSVGNMAGRWSYHAWVCSLNCAEFYIISNIDKINGSKNECPK